MVALEIEKLEEILLDKFSIHESDYLIRLITDENKTTEDVQSFLRYCNKCSQFDIPSDIDEFEKVTNNK